jgi:hypothetical protein
VSQRCPVKLGSRKCKREAEILSPLPAPPIPVAEPGPGVSVDVPECDPIRRLLSGLDTAAPEIMTCVEWRSIGRLF